MFKYIKDSIPKSPGHKLTFYLLFSHSPIHHLAFFRHGAHGGLRSFTVALSLSLLVPQFYSSLLLLSNAAFFDHHNELKVVAKLDFIVHIRRYAIVPLHRYAVKPLFRTLSLMHNSLRKRYFYTFFIKSNFKTFTKFTSHIPLLKRFGITKYLDYY